MRTKHGVATRRRRKKVLKLAKGYWGKRSKHYRRAIETVRRAGVYAYRDRRVKKREFRSLWITRINAATRERGVPYRIFIHKLKEKNILISRDILAKIASEYPEVFDKIVEVAKN
ncbi:MAG: 50S ribosomal protein L20 [Candidatus Omnitrophica bacterium]|nr:50S ribosomal protein L20 [Candidatus Omnitrophota bacterium]MCM8827383.1 50S ribosomal protein L20 [Candidatus Omnitrophota bacterium]